MSIFNSILFELRTAQARLEFYEKHKRALDELASYCDDVGLSYRLWIDDFGIASFGTMGVLYGLDSKLRDMGYTDSTTDLPESTVDYFSSYYTGEGLPKVHLTFTNTVCERTIVGYESKPIYEVKCS